MLQGEQREPLQGQNTLDHRDDERSLVFSLKDNNNINHIPTLEGEREPDGLNFLFQTNMLVSPRSEKAVHGKEDSNKSPQTASRGYIDETQLFNQLHQEYQKISEPTLESKVPGEQQQGKSVNASKHEEDRT